MVNQVMGLLSILLLLAGVSSCKGEAQELSATANPDFQVSLLFEHEGCRVYRFFDYGNPRYYVHCIGVQSVSEWTEVKPSGKTTVLSE